MADQRDIKYTDRTFNEFRQQLIDFTQNYFPDTYNDFSEASPGMLFMEQAAYIGDVLSLYQDIQFQETFRQYAEEKKNLYDLAYEVGYTPKVTCASSVELDIYQRVDYVVDGNGDRVPDYDQALVIDENAQFESTTGEPVRFITDRKVDFSFSSSFDPTEVSVYSTAANKVTQFLLKKKVKAISGEVKTQTFTIGAVEPYKTITIDDDKIIGVLDITDSNGYTWYEVPYLAQDTIFQEIPNTGPDKNMVQSSMQLLSVPRRFVTRFSTDGILKIQFGAGTQTTTSDKVITPDPTHVGIGTDYGRTKLDKAYDPSNFMFTRAYGLAPNRVELTVRYLVGGGVEANVPANSITNIKSIVTSAIDTSNDDTVAVNNPKPATGGRDGDTVEELRQNSLKAYTEQLRAVNREDFILRAVSMPTRFGGICKAYLLQDDLTTTKSLTDNIVDGNPLSLSLYVLAYDNDKKLTTLSDTTRENLQTYLSQYRMLTDAINIKDAFIVNIGVTYDIILRPGFVGRDVLLRCTQALKDYFSIEKWKINQPINISNIYTLLDKVKGVQTVQNVSIENKVGGSYSQYAYDIKGATKNGIVYPSYDPCIFEVKYPNQDIKGRITTL